jgi:DNA-binding response OmpR family regulator
VSPASTTLLVCDDTAAKRYVISSWLRRAGYAVIGAGSASEAMEVVTSQDVDLVVLDVHLPDRSGLEVAVDLKTNVETAAIPIVHISAVAVEPEQRSAGLDRGADAYLIDPIEPQELVSTVGALLRSSSARRRAESMATRLGRLHRASLRLNVASSAPRLADASATGAHLVFGGRSAAVVVSDDATVPTQVMRRMDPSGSLDVAVVEPTVLQDALLRAPDLGRVLTDDAPWDALLTSRAGGVDVAGAAGVDSWLVSTIRSRNEVVGLVAVEGAVVDTHDEKLLAELTQAAGVAVENLRAMEQEHRTALVLQRSLLPAVLPDLAGLSLVARYRAADGAAQIGGDFFDAFETEDGRTHVVIGDVQGHSLEAAVLMAELRYTLRAYAHDGYSPSEVLSRVDQTLARSRPDMTATLCLLALDPAEPNGSRGFEVANAGHLPPLLVRDGEASYLEAHGPLLGALLGPPEPTRLTALPGDRLVLVTDGLVERRGEDLGENLDRFARKVSGSPLSPEALCDAVMVDHGDVGDDSALVLVDVLAP